MFGAVAGIAGGLLGAIGGAAGTPSSGYQDQNTTSSVSLRDFNELNKGASGLENTTYQNSLSAFGDFSNLINAGPGASAVSAANTNANDFSSLLQSFVSNSGLPTAAQTSAAQGYASQIFDPQRLAMKQSFVDQNIQGQRLAARLGRAGADPVLQAKLGIEQTRQSQMLNSQQGAFAAQTAHDMPGQQYNFANALYNVRQNLASQAFNNRSTLLTMGQQLLNSERQYRLNTATKKGTNFTSYDGKTGGGLGGAIGGMLAGVGAGAGAASKMS